MTTAIRQRTIVDALFFEPIELIVSQPHQALISSASIYLIAAEAGMLVEWPYNVLLGIGAEWAYLRGFSSGQHVTTPWANRLNWSAVILVVMYGSLWGLRKFGAIPDAVPVWAAVLLTMIHILCIGAVTLCSAMTHSAMLAAERVSREKQLRIEDERNRAKVAADEERNRRLQQAQDELAIEMRRRDAELRLMEETARRKIQIASERAQLRSATRQAVAGATLDRRIIVDDVEYPSIQAAADAYGISRQAMSKRLRNGRHP